MFLQNKIVPAHFDHLREWAYAAAQDDSRLVLGPDFDYVSFCHSIESVPELEEMFEVITPDLNTISPLQCFRTNGYLRVYRRGAVLNRHVDRDDVYLTMSISLYHDGPVWPLYENGIAHYDPIVLMESRKNFHWRNTFTGTLSIVGILMWSDDITKNQFPNKFIIMRDCLSQCDTKEQAYSTLGTLAEHVNKTTWSFKLLRKPGITNTRTIGAYCPWDSKNLIIEHTPVISLKKYDAIFFLPNVSFLYDDFMNTKKDIALWLYHA